MNEWGKMQVGFIFWEGYLRKYVYGDLDVLINVGEIKNTFT